MTEREMKKLEQIAKIEKKIEKYGSKLTEEQKTKAIELSWRELDEYCGRNFDLLHTIEGYYRASKELEDAKNTLEKIRRQEAKAQAKENILTKMPTALKEFADQLEESWNTYDKDLRAFYKKEYASLKYSEFIKKYRGGYRHMMKTDEEIEKENHEATQTLIINLFNRVYEKVGEITDAKYLEVTRGNMNYPVINGKIIGTKGTAVVESIGAGGYNIQRYHIRTLVKQSKQSCGTVCQR